MTAPTSAVQSPRIFGRPLWSWAAWLTTRFDDHPTDRWPNGHPKGVLKRRCRIARAVLWPLCRALTGHRQALGETGYGGNGWISVFCAYCAYPWQIPASETPSAGHLVELFHGWPTPEIKP